MMLTFQVAATQNSGFFLGIVQVSEQDDHFTLCRNGLEDYHSFRTGWKQFSG
ncbi:MAG TPA: hypothetical protein VIX12_08845 [Candidatus Binataceae bacterium]